GGQRARASPPAVLAAARHPRAPPRAARRADPAADRGDAGAARARRHAAADGPRRHARADWGPLSPRTGGAARAGPRGGLSTPGPPQARRPPAHQGAGMTASAGGRSPWTPGRSHHDPPGSVLKVEMAAESRSLTGVKPIAYPSLGACDARDTPGDGAVG